MPLFNFKSKIAQAIAKDVGRRHQLHEASPFMNASQPEQPIESANDSPSSEGDDDGHLSRERDNSDHLSSERAANTNGAYLNYSYCRTSAGGPSEEVKHTSAGGPSDEVEDNPDEVEDDQFASEIDDNASDASFVRGSSPPLRGIVWGDTPVPTPAEEGLAASREADVYEQTP